jgi:hypothetical protein
MPVVLQKKYTRHPYSAEYGQKKDGVSKTKASKRYKLRDNRKRKTESYERLKELMTED